MQRESQEGGASRGIALTDDAAAAWLAGRGWTAVAGVRGPIRLFADDVGVHGLRMSRVWHTPLRVARTPDASSGGPLPRIDLITIVDGSLTVRSDARETSLQKGDSVLLPTSEGVEVVNSEATGRVEFSLPLRDGLGSSLLPAHGSTLEASHFSRILVALASSILASPLTPTENGYPQLMNAVEDAALAFLRNAAARERLTHVSSAEAALYSRALDLIDEESGDPDFSVALLAERLRISSRRVSQVFAAHGSTAQGALRAVRAGRAARLLEDRRVTSALEREEVARAAGFRNARAMLAGMRG